jgi:transcription initiation factor IIE alpha subunit
MHIQAFVCSKCGKRVSAYDTKERKFSVTLDKPYNNFYKSDPPCDCGTNEWLIDVSDWA